MKSLCILRSMKHHERIEDSSTNSKQRGRFARQILHVIFLESANQISCSCTLTTISFSTVYGQSSLCPLSLVKKINRRLWIYSYLVFESGQSVYSNNLKPHFLTRLYKTNSRKGHCFACTSTHSVHVAAVFLEKICLAWQL